MRKQTKLVAVLSAAALLAIGASMTSFAATGWAEEDGTWVYYDKDGSKVESEWKKSGEKWFFLNDDGEMATESLVEDNDNYYYVNGDGVMVTNQWVEVANDDDTDDNAPAAYWYYFQANGKAYKAPTTGKTNFKTINGKKYAFTEEGKMLYGWVNGESTRMSEDDGWKSEDTKYFMGEENDGALTTGWRQIQVIDSDNEDGEDQTYWFYFLTNGAKVEGKEKTIGSKKYRFADDSGKMVAEWFTAASNSVASNNGAVWQYFNSPEDGARMTKGWFKVVPDEILNDTDNANDDANWYYADGKGYLYTDTVKKINGKYYAFGNDGAMLSGLRAMTITGSDVADPGYKLDDQSKLDKAIEDNLDVFYFGTGDDGAMKLGAQTVDVDGDNYNFYFNKSGDEKGMGFTGLKDKVFYTSGKKLKASSDDKLVVVEYNENTPDVAPVILSTAELKAKGTPTSNSEGTKYTFSVSTANSLYVIGTSGTYAGSKTNAKDGNDWYFNVKANHITSFANYK